VACDIAAGGDPGAASIPGFTQISSHYTPAGFLGSIRLTTLYKIASSESGNYTASWASSAACAWSIVGISGNAASSPVDQSNTNNDTSASSVNIVAPSLTGLTAADDLLLCAFATCGGASYTMPAGLTTITNNNQPNTDSVFLGVGYKALTGSGATGTFTATATGGNPNEAASVAFKAAGGGGGGGVTDDVAARGGVAQALVLMRERASGLFEPVREILKPWRPVMA